MRKKLTNIVAAALTACLLVTGSAAAPTEKGTVLWEDPVQVGLAYGSSALVNANLENAIAGIRVSRSYTSGQHEAEKFGADRAFRCLGYAEDLLRAMRTNANDQLAIRAFCLKIAFK